MIAWSSIVGCVAAIISAIAILLYTAQNVVMINGVNLNYDNGQLALMSEKIPRFLLLNKTN